MLRIFHIINMILSDRDKKKNKNEKSLHLVSSCDRAIFYFCSDFFFGFKQLIRKFSFLLFVYFSVEPFYFQYITDLIHMFTSWVYLHLNNFSLHIRTKRHLCSNICWFTRQTDLNFQFVIHSVWSVYDFRDMTDII